MTPKETRIHLGITQTEFARLVGVHPQTVSKWERALLQPTPWQCGIIERLAKSRGVRRNRLKELLLKYGAVKVLSIKLGPR